MILEYPDEEFILFSILKVTKKFVVSFTTNFLNETAIFH